MNLGSGWEAAGTPCVYWSGNSGIRPRMSWPGIESHYVRARLNRSAWMTGSRWKNRKE